MNQAQAVPSKLSDIVEAHRSRFEKYYEPGILDPSYHMQLVESMDKWARIARVPKFFIYKTSMTLYCGESEIDYVKDFREHSDNNIAGLMFHGPNITNVEDRMFAMAGAFLRNHVNAQVIPLYDLLQGVKNGEAPSASVVFVPNFWLPKTGGGDIPDWQSSMLTSWLLDRFASGTQTVLYAKNLKEMGASYGQMVGQHIIKHFQTLTN